MQEPNPSPPPVPADLEASLHELSVRLREAEQLGADERRSLAELLDQLARMLHPTSPHPEESTHLAQSSAQLAEALKQRRDRGTVASAIQRLEQAAARAEAEAPVAAGFARQLLEILANFGI